MIKCNLERHICVKLVYVYDPNVVQESLLGSRAVLGCRGESLSLLLPPSPALKLLYLSPLSLPPPLPIPYTVYPLPPTPLSCFFIYENAFFYPCAECGIREMESVEKKEEGGRRGGG